MKTLQRNITNLYGQKGKDWLNSLPIIVNKLSQRWRLTNIKPVDKMSWNYVALAIQNKSTPVVLKISCDKKLIQDEYRTLKHFDGRGAIKVISMDSDNNALLLERAVPGCLLKDHHPLKIEETIIIYANVVKQLAVNAVRDASYTHVNDWCNAIDTIHDSRIPKHYIDKAKQLRSVLLMTMQHEYICHGDLHLENIIQQGSAWIAIDSKGIVGEVAFEAAAFDLIKEDEMKDVSLIPAKITHRLTLLSRALEVDFDRLIAWVFLRIIISAQWFIEDNSDPSQMLTLAGYVYPLV